MNKRKAICLITDRFDSEVYYAKKNQLSDYVDIKKSPLTQHKDIWPDIECLIIRSGTKITSSVLNSLPRLKLIVTATSGFDHIDLEACSNKNITVCYTPTSNVQSAAEHTFALLLSSHRKTKAAHTGVRAGDWRRELYIGTELSGKKIGLIGYGRIGKKVAQIALAFGMDVLVHDPYINHEEFPTQTFLGFEEVMRSADVISFHVPLTSETKHMIKESTLDWLKEDTTLINISRGPVVCMNSLIKYLADHPTMRVCMDVFPKEPLSQESPLLSYQNLTLSPHIGATTKEALFKSSLEAFNKVFSYYNDEKTSDSLPPKALWASKIIKN